MRANRSRLEAVQQPLELHNPVVLLVRAGHERVATRSLARTSSCFTCCASFSSISTFFSSFLLSSRAARVRKARAEASTASPDAPASTGRPGVGRLSPEKCRRLRSLSAARAPRGCPAAPPEVVSSVPVGRRARRAPPPPRPWQASDLLRCGATSLPGFIATVIRSCCSHERSRRCRLRAAAFAVSTPTLVDIIKAQQKKSPAQNESNLSGALGGGGGGTDEMLMTCLCRCATTHATNWGDRTPGSQTPDVPATPSPRQRRTIRLRGLQKLLCTVP